MQAIICCFNSGIILLMVIPIATPVIKFVPCTINQEVVEFKITLQMIRNSCYHQFWGNRRSLGYSEDSLQASHLIKLLKQLPADTGLLYYHFTLCESNVHTLIFSRRALFCQVCSQNWTKFCKYGHCKNDVFWACLGQLGERWY